jgi:hypothetical protein
MIFKFDVIRRTLDSITVKEKDFVQFELSLDEFAISFEVPKEYSVYNNQTELSKFNEKNKTNFRSKEKYNTHIDWFFIPESSARSLIITGVNFNDSNLNSSEQQITDHTKHLSFQEEVGRTKILLNVLGFNLVQRKIGIFHIPCIFLIDSCYLYDYQVKESLIYKENKLYSFTQINVFVNQNVSLFIWIISDRKAQNQDAINDRISKSVRFHKFTTATSTNTL